MNTQELSVQDRVHHYVEAVRAALADLAPEVVDDLTEGLEADLADWVTDDPAGLAGLPEPRSYAAELRSAAGLPEGGQPPATSRWWERDAWTPTVAAWARARDENPWLARIAGVADELRPVGWVLRGIIIALLAIALWDIRHGWILGVVLAVVSVWAGRGRRTAGRWGRVVLVGAGALAVVGAVPAYWAAAELANPPSSVSAYDYLGAGMYFQGRPVDNIYLYGADGSRLTNVRAFDGNGHPLNLSSRWSRPDGTPLPAVSDQYGTAWANLLPVDVEAKGDPWGLVMGSLGSWEAPKVLAPLDLQTPAPSPTPSATAVPTPSATPAAPPKSAPSGTRAPTPSATPAPTPSATR